MIVNRVVRALGALARASWVLACTAAALHPLPYSGNHLQRRLQCLSGRGMGCHTVVQPGQAPAAAMLCCAALHRV